MKSFFLFILIMLLTCLIGTSLNIAYADSKGSKSRKVQEVSFDGTDIDGEARRPEASYLVQKRGVDFVPLYNVRKQFDENIKESVEYLK